MNLHVVKQSLAIILFLCCYGCTDPVTPEFNFKTGLIYIDGLLTNVPGDSYVVVSESANEFGINKTVFVEGASVSFVKIDDGTIIDLAQEGEEYLPPLDFSADIGETWELNVVLKDGRQYRSLPETLEEAVPIKDLSVVFNPELYFDADFDRFVPGHTLSVSFNDPPEERNYYYWRFRSYEKLVNCRVCFNSYLREGECQSVPAAVAGAYKPYYTYVCESDCWQIRYGDKIEIFSDEFTDGIGIVKLPVAEILLNSKKNILVELRQFTLSEKAYEYYQTLKDIVEDNSGFNSPLPAALVGNLYNPEDNNEFVLGRFTGTAAISSSIWIDRTFIEGQQLEDELVTQPEGFGEPTPEPQVFSAPCNESRYRTSILPEGWQD